MKQSFKARGGYSLVEVMVYVALTATASLLLTSFMVDVVRQAADTKVTKYVQDDAHTFFARVAGDIRRAIRVEQVALSELRLLDRDGQIIRYAWTDDPTDPDYMRIMYDDGSGVLQPVTSAGVAVTDLQFSNPIPASLDEVTVDVTLYPRNADGTAAAAHGVHLSSTIVNRDSLY